jgi:hypothetical protein
MWSENYAANNSDFAWAFYLKNGTTNQVKIVNPYGDLYWVQSGIYTAGRIAISTTNPDQASVYTISAPITAISSQIIPPGIYTVPEVLNTINKNSPFCFQLNNGYVNNIVSPIINLPFNGSNVDTINNLTNTANASDLPIYTSGKFVQGIYLNNATANTYVYYYFKNILPTVSKIYIDNGVTMCFWANYNSFAYATSILYDEYISDVSANLLSIGITSTTTINGYNQGTFGNYLQPKQITGSFSTGTWYHLAITFSKYACIAYLNGAVGSSNVFVSPVTTGIEYTGLRFGRKTNNNDANIGYDGSDVIISDARVYNTALTPAQINSIYNQSGMNFPSVTSITNSPGSLMNMLGFAPGTIGYGAIAPNLPYLNANEYISLFIENVGVSSNENRQISYKIPTGSIVHQNVSFPPVSWISFTQGDITSVTQVIAGSPYIATSSSPPYNGNNSSKAFFGSNYNDSTDYDYWKPVSGNYSNGTYLGSNVTTDYVTGAVYPGEWVQLQLPVQIVLQSYTVGRDAFGGLSNIKLLGSTDGSKWIFIRSSSGGVIKLLKPPDLFRLFISDSL